MITLDRPLDEVLARAAISWTLDPGATPEDVADRLLSISRGNRTAVERALRRVAARRLSRATVSLRLALAHGDWAW